jgi:hypothetical protein
MSTMIIAYIDPSAGGMLVQFLLAGTAGVAVLVKLFWSRLRGTFGLRDDSPPEVTPKDSGPGATSDHDPV